VTGSRVAAFFDVDHTLIELNSGAQWLKHLWKHGRIGPVLGLRSLIWLMQYRASVLDFDGMLRKVVKFYEGDDIAELEAEVRAWFEAEIRWSICREARAKVEEHRAAGDLLVILSSTTRFLAEPLARELQIEHVLCTELEAEGGRLTGRHIAPPCYGPGKVVHAERFAAAHAVDLARSHFYTDSYSDMPMLERVGLPHVVNPDLRLDRASARLGWRVERWTAEGVAPTGT